MTHLPPVRGPVHSGPRAGGFFCALPPGGFPVPVVDEATCAARSGGL